MIKTQMVIRCTRLRKECDHNKLTTLVQQTRTCQQTHNSHNNIDPQRVSGQNHVDRMQHFQLLLSKMFVHITVWLANHQSLTNYRTNFMCSLTKITVVLNLKCEHSQSLVSLISCQSELICLQLSCNQFLLKMLFMLFIRI